MTDDGSVEVSEDLHAVEIYFKKYIALRKRCEQIQQSNEKLVNRLQHVKKMIKRYRKERKFLMMKLDQHGDNYRDKQVPYMWEETEMFGSTLMPPPLGGATGPDAMLASGSEHAIPSVAKKSPETPRRSTQSKPKKSQAAKSTPAPKSAFLQFYQQQSALMQDEYFKDHNEEMSHQELTRRLVGQWNAMEDDKKQVYYDLCALEKEKYDEDFSQDAKSDLDTTGDGASSFADIDEDSKPPATDTPDKADTSGGGQYSMEDSPVDVVKTELDT